MLEITVPSLDFWDEEKLEFVDTEAVTLKLEHSLVSLSKWESKWEIPFLGDDPRTSEQTIDYIKAMTLNDNVPPDVYARLTDEIVEQVSEYIAAKQTATWFAEKPQPKGRKETITAEVIYYWMIALTIPFECQDWHLNRLLTLVKVCNQKNAPQKKLSRSEIAQRNAKNRELNEQRKAQLKTTG